MKKSSEDIKKELRREIKLAKIKKELAFYLIL